ncbi:cytochrome P450 [Bradyrhizobium sp. 2S1]|uniref:cytochrome P450 n=1 Tax=Bradyrhizobium sp. 2S1 TaxID=1404429 RepID=UPI001CD1027A|nr:cytochrome P450 [Bradyrhizobium sp. 2S1]MCK7671413.1 cytochrome P450 [Bradyrhizobium sp. 2S1]
MIDGAGNYAADAEIERKAMQASADVDTAIGAVLELHRSNPNPSILSSMVNADPPMPIEAIRANIKVIIGGGLNEPRDAILTLVLGLLENPVQKDSVLAKPELWPAALEEAVRWISPIGMYPRRVTRSVDLSGITLPEGLQIGLCVGAANRDGSRFADPDRFDMMRPKQSHLAFGAGPHFCAGTRCRGLPSARSWRQCCSTACATCASARRHRLLSAAGCSAVRCRCRCSGIRDERVCASVALRPRSCGRLNSR